MDEIFSFYQQLYSEKKLNLDPNYFNDIELPQVKPEDILLLNAPIQMDEIKIALHQLNLGKCPGLDGLDPSFYLKFWPDLKYSLHSVFKKAESQYTLPSSTRSGVISLMEKLSRNSLLVHNWRPLSILNTDYKIFAKLLANRLQMVLPYLIHSDQKGFMKNRHITDNLSDLLTIIEYCELTKQQAIIMAIDFEKAFDTITWEALLSILRKFGFPEHFINLIMTYFKNFRISVTNNGFFTSKFTFQQGTKQGCPLSSLIFNLVVEIIGLKLRQSKDIKGIKLYGTEKKLGQFADDLWTATKYDKGSFKAQMRIFKEYQAFTGLSINYNKTEVMRIGSLKYTDAKLYSDLPLKWSDGPVRILGLDIYSQTELTIKRNYESILNKAKTQFDTWRVRNLSLIGKMHGFQIHVANTLAIPQFQYVMQILPNIPDNILKDFNSALKHYLWDGGKTKIAHDRLIQNWENGGLKLIDLRTKDLSTKLVQFLASDEPHK